MSEEKYIETKVLNTDKTQKIAEQFARELHPGDVVAFYGDLGTGKTFFIKALCRALGVEQEATSPSFTIINEYHTKEGLYIYHFDFYRIENEAELVNLGLDEFFYNDYLCFIEWADRIEKELPENCWNVHLEFLKNKPEGRKIVIKKRYHDEKRNSFYSRYRK